MEVLAPVGEPVGEHLLVFLLAATPWLEILIVIPVAIAYGLNPVGVTVVAFIGNTLPVWGVILAYNKWVAWRRKRKEEYSFRERESGESVIPANSPSSASPQCLPGSGGSTDNADKTTSKVKKRARHIFDRYGLPGLALLGPAVTGIYSALLLALALKCPLRSIAFWMTISLACWSLAIGLVSFYGLDWLGWLAHPGS